jgi:uncharacterized SAM-binding protein YcdF (DUF218 family)
MQAQISCDEKTLENAGTVFSYLSMRDPEKKADIIVGFGHFDMNIPRQCGALYKKGLAGKILFTGGRGAGTADLEGTEGAAFRKELMRVYPDIPEDAVIVEDDSTNTGENVRFSEALLKARDPFFCFSNGIKSAIAVANPYRQRRVFLTLKKLYHYVEVVNLPPEASLQGEMLSYAGKGQDYIRLLTDEVGRLIRYPLLGYISYEPVPLIVKRACLRINRLYK